MKLYATMTSDRGKPLSKASNDTINITFTQDKNPMFDVEFNGDNVKVMRYYDASWDTIEYIPK